LALILNIESGGAFCSACIARDGEVIANCQETAINSHASKITLTIEQVLAEAALSMQQLDAIAISEGPGSYTGLRIGASTAKGLAYTLNKPLIKVSSFDILLDAASAVSASFPITTLIQAKKNAFYYQSFLAEHSPISLPMIMRDVEDKAAVKEIMRDQKIVINSSNEAIIYVLKKIGIEFDIVNSNAKNMAKCSFFHYANKNFESPILFEPFYLGGFGKDF
jgi:tRNA threonylcarbamoyladenosine biosynthesis protein TsaB